MASRTRISAVALVLLLTAAGCGDTEDDVGERVEEGVERTESTLERATRMTATLTGAAEAPPGDPDGAGTATVNVDVGKGEVCFEVSVQRLDPPVGMHIHEGEAGRNGRVVVPLTPTPPNGDAGATGCARPEAAVIARILADSGDFYVNVHTGPFPDGAVRGQLERA